MHFDISGGVDRMAPKSELFLLGGAVLLLPLTMELTIWILKHKKQTEKQSARNASNIRVTENITLWTTVFYVAATLLMLSAAFSGTDHMTGQLPIAGILCVMEGAMMIVLGNYLPKTYPNGLVGLRCSWTLYNEKTWTRSNRFCGKTLMAAGFLTIFSAILPGMWCLYLMILWLTGSILASLLYAYKTYKEEIQHE